MSQLGTNWNFQPHPLLANGHLQSIAGIRWPTKFAPYQAIQHPVPLADGDQLVLHEDAPPAAHENTPIVLLIHGLAGGFFSTYMRRMTEKLTTRGYRVFRLDLRGCGAGEAVAKSPTHCGRSSDVASALDYLAKLYPELPTSLVAFSMGGTLTMNLLAEAGEMRVGNLQRSFVICPPIDLTHTEQHFRTFWGRRYDQFFVRLIWEQVLRRWQHFPEIAPSQIPKRPKRLRDIDELIIVPTGGFASVEDYYQQSSPGPKLASIKQPLTLVFSEDDPVVPIEPLFDSVRNSSIETITTRHGGHLGFLAGRHDDPDFRWLDWRIIDWLEEERQPECKTRKDQAHTSKPQRLRSHSHSATKSQVEPAR